MLILFLVPVLFSACRSGADGCADVAFVGDSITVGHRASRLSETFAAFVSRELKEDGLDIESRLFISVNPDRNAAVVREAMSGAPEIVVLELGVHSVIEGHISADAFRARYRVLLDCVAARDTIAVVGTIPWLGWDADSEEFSRAALFSEIIRQEADRKEVGVADLWTATKLNSSFLSRPGDRFFLPPYHGDSFHPGDAGHALIARLYLEQLRDALERPPDRPYERSCG